MRWWYLLMLLAANLALLLPATSPWRVAGAMLLIGLLPGLSWARRLLGDASFPLRWLTASGLSYVFSSLGTLLLTYFPGSINSWHLLLAFNIIALLPLLTDQIKINRAYKTGDSSTALSLPLPFLLILVVALLLRTVNLHYSEFQGDEALAMIAAAEALDGHEDALFLRAKGPGEILLPMALWRLSGTINEPIARLPFTTAALLAVVTIYLIGAQAGERRIGWGAAGFFAFNGFMVAFGRIVQYQALVIWLSALAFLMLMQWRQTRQHHLAALGGLFLGTGLLAHYDAILVMPALGWLLLAPPPLPPGASQNSGNLDKPEGSGGNSPEPPLSAQKLWTTNSSPGQFLARWRRSIAGAIKPALLFGGALALTVVPFYLPFSFDPQANRTGAYVGQRIGAELRNNLPDFFHFTTFYSSAYYLILTGLLVLGVLVWFIWQTGRVQRRLSLLILLGVLAVIFKPDLLGSLSFLPFALLLLGAFLTTPSGFNRPDIQAIIVWLAVPFLGYSFIVALGLTHIYTTVPAWSLLAALGWYHLDRAVSQSSISKLGLRPSPLSWLLGLFLLLSTIFLWNAFIRHDLEYWQDYPDGGLSLFWTPYDRLPQAGFFGFAHRAGWKALGQKIANGELVGDYRSNEEPDVTTWYTRGAPRACDPQPEFYFLAPDLIDPVEVPAELIASHYDQIGSVTLPNQKQMRIMQQQPVALALGPLDDEALAREFDRSATPAAFARSARGAIPSQVNFGNRVRLIGYDLDTRRAYPGGRLPVTLYWQAMSPLPASYHVFVHLESASGPAAQADGVPVCWSYPTDLWRPGQIIADQHALPISAETPPGFYPLEIGLYLPDSFERLEVLDIAGNPAGVSVTLTEIEVRNQ